MAALNDRVEPVLDNTLTYSVGIGPCDISSFGISAKAQQEANGLVA